ncbi:hypothetical protein NYA9BBAC_00222 [Salinibacterium sp. NYA9b]
MSEIFATVLGALAVIGIPLVAWFSRRATREGRLLLRIERLGAAYALMPISPEKDSFEVHLIGAITDLNEWLEADNAKRRKLIRLIHGWIYAIGVIAVFIAIPSLETAERPWQSFLIGSVLGITIAAVTIGASFLLERGARAKSALAAKEREEGAAALRMKALLKGEPIPMAQDFKPRL